VFFEVLRLKKYQMMSEDPTEAKIIAISHWVNILVRDLISVLSV